MVKEELLNLLNELKRKEEDLLDIVTGRTLHKNFPFKSLVFLLNITISSFYYSRGLFLKCILILIFTEFVASLGLGFYLDKKYFLPARNLVATFINSVYRGRYYLEFPSSIHARLFLVSERHLQEADFNGTKIKLPRSFDIYLQRVSVQSYIDILTIIEKSAAQEEFWS